MPSIKQIGTICFTLSFIIFPNFTFADNITAVSTCTNGVLGTYTGPADIEANFDPNTINTTWYSNGTQLTGNNIPATCTYDNALTPPTPAPRAGYVFGGWTLKPPPCEIPSTDVSNNGNAYASKRLNGGGDITYGGATAATYGITEPGEWGVSWSNGDKVTGVALCSQTSGGTPYETGSGDSRYCWCKATHYTANNAQQCSLSSPSWVYYLSYLSAAECASGCAVNCAYTVMYGSSLRAALFAGNIAQ